MKRNLLCVGLASAAVNLGTVPVDPTKVQRGVSTVQYEGNTNFKPCSCDLTANSCDAFCCCDKQCSAVSQLFLNDERNV